MMRTLGIRRSQPESPKERPKLPNWKKSNRTATEKAGDPLKGRSKLGPNGADG